MLGCKLVFAFVFGLSALSRSFLDYVWRYLRVTGSDVWHGPARRGRFWQSLLPFRGYCRFAIQSPGLCKFLWVVENKWQVIYLLQSVKTSTLAVLSRKEF